MDIDITKLKKLIRSGAVPLPTTEHAGGYNKGIEHALEIIEKIETGEIEL